MSLLKDALEIRVIPRKWSWSFAYPNGASSNDLVVPAGKPIKLLMSSTEVIDGFFIPDFRFNQQDVFAKPIYHRLV